MTEYTRSYDITIDAPIHEVFEYCRDPRHLFEGWPQLQVTEVNITPEGIGTTAHIVGTFGKGLIIQQVEREFTEFTPDEMIVSRAHGKIRFVGRVTMETDLPTFTWLFEDADPGTKVTMIFQEEDLNWFEDLVDYASAPLMRKNLNSMLEAVKAGIESEVGSKSQ